MSFYVMPASTYNISAPSYLFFTWLVSHHYLKEYGIKINPSLKNAKSVGHSSLLDCGTQRPYKHV
jgi:hypothetical protein